MDSQIIVRCFNTKSLANLRRLAALFACACLALATSAASAQGIGESAVQLVDGSSFTCQIESIDKDGRVVGKVSGEGATEGFNIAQVLSLQTKRTVTKTESQVTFYPAGGGEIYGNELTVGNEALAFKNSASGAIQMPLQSIRAVVWTDSESVKSAIASPSKDNDQIVVKVSDGERVVEGILEAVDKDFLQVNFKNESRQIGLAKVQAFVVADLAFKSPAGSMATVELVDGSRFVGVIGGLAEGDLKLEVAGGASLKIKAAKIVQISIVSDRLAYLSDIKPSNVEEKSLFAIQLTWQRDRSVGNNPIRLNGGKPRKAVEFRKGIGMQSFSLLSFANTNEFDRFKSVVGIDAETQGRGDCQMVVRGDGIELWSKRIKAADEPQQVDVDITGIKEISLIVYPGEDFDLSDHADWGEARFLKTK